VNDLPKVVSLLPESAGVELATFRVKVQCHNRYAFMPDCFKSHFGMWSHGARGALWGSYLVMPRLACAQCNSQLCLLGGSTDVASSCVCTVATVATAGPAIWNSLPDDVALPHLY